MAKSNRNDIPAYDLDKFKHVHREGSLSTFGYDNLHPSRFIPGFELFSSAGLVSSVGPLRSDFYRLSITCRGTLDMQIGLDHYRHQPRTISLTYPNQIFAKSNISADAFGYYMLFISGFLDSLVPSLKFTDEFPFFDVSGTPLFQLTAAELEQILGLIFKINEELTCQDTGRVVAVRMYLYLILLEARRSYEKQQLHLCAGSQESSRILSRFRKLVALHILSKRQVADYADMLAVSPDHLNKVVKNISGKTASETIREMLLLEAKSLLKYTDQTIAEIAFKLRFSDPASFNRFFRSGTGQTPLKYRVTPESGSIGPA